jgi:hypothetical protein
MTSPITISVNDGTSGGAVELVSMVGPTEHRVFIALGRPDTATDKVGLCFGNRTFTKAACAMWIGPGERLLFTPDDTSLWPLLNAGIYALTASGVTVDVNVQVG